MRINNDTVLIYGWIFDWNELEDHIRKILKKSEEDDDEYFELAEEFEKYIETKFQLDFSSASPYYYDSDWTDKVFYISLLTKKTEGKDLTEKIKFLLNKEYQIPEELNLLITSTPKLFVLSSIW